MVLALEVVLELILALVLVLALVPALAVLVMLVAGAESGSDKLGGSLLNFHYGINRLAHMYLEQCASRNVV